MVNTTSGALIGFVGSIGMPLIFAAPLCGLINTVANTLTGDIKSLEEGAQCFAVSTLISFLTLGIAKMTNSERMPVFRNGNYIEAFFRAIGKTIDPYIAFLVGFLNGIKEGDD